MRELVLSVVLLLGIVWGAHESAASDQGGAAETAVSYVSGSTVYVDAGRNAGIAVGDTLRAVRDAETVAVLVVTYISSQRAACDVVQGTAELRAGDRVLYRPGPLPPTPTQSTTVVPASATTDTEAGWMRRAGLRGRVGLRYLAALDRTGFGSDISRPAIDLRVDGRRVGGSDFDLNVDVRASHTTRKPESGGSSKERRTRVYGLSAAWRPVEGRYLVLVGRQYSPVLASHSFFDGVRGAIHASRWEVGALAGTQPDPDHSPSTDIWQYSLYGRYGSETDVMRRWDATMGLVGSYEHGEINREFLYLQGRYSDELWLATATQELDVNRGWKRDAGGDAVSFTNTYLSLRRRLRPGFDLDVGFDDRSNVLLYRDRETPETLFDDSHRQGYWGGAHLRFLERYSAGLRIRSTQGSSVGDANSATLTLGGRQIARLWNLRGRVTGYRNDIFDGLLYSASAGCRISRAITVDISGGQRTESVRRGNYDGSTLSWIGLDADIYLGYGWFLALSGERSFGSDDMVDQLYANLTYRF